MQNYIFTSGVIYLLSNDNYLTKKTNVEKIVWKPDIVGWQFNGKNFSLYTLEDNEFLAINIF